MKALLVAAAMMVGGYAAPAQAQFLHDYRKWMEIGDAARAGFVMGSFDRLVIISAEEPYDQAIASGAATCFGNLRLKSSDISKMITKAYEDNPELWRETPTALMQYSLFRVCGADINRSLVARGQTPPVNAASFLANLLRGAAIR